MKVIQSQIKLNIWHIQDFTLNFKYDAMKMMNVKRFASFCGVVQYFLTHMAPKFEQVDQNVTLLCHSPPVTVHSWFSHALT